MSKQTFYAYALGTDHAAAAAPIEERLDALVASRRWSSKDVWVVNQQEPPHWDLGLNMTLAPPRSRPAGWIEDVVAIAEVLAELHRATGTRFVLGLANAATDETEDLFTIECDAPDLDGLRAAFAPATPARKRA